MMELRGDWVDRAPTIGIRALFRIANFFSPLLLSWWFSPLLLSGLSRSPHCDVRSINSGRCNESFHCERFPVSVRGIHRRSGSTQLGFVMSLSEAAEPH